MADTGVKVCGKVESETWSAEFTKTLINTSDGNYAQHSGTIYEPAEISDFNFGIPAGVIINGIRAKAQFRCDESSSTAYIRLSLSYNDGVSWTTAKINTAGFGEDILTYGGPTNLWGRVWTAEEFADGVFRVKVEGKASASSVLLNYFEMTVYYTEEITFVPRIIMI